MKLSEELEKVVKNVEQEIQGVRNVISIKERELVQDKAYLNELRGKLTAYTEVLNSLKDVHNGKQPHNLPSGEGVKEPLGEGGQADDGATGG